MVHRALLAALLLALPACPLAAQDHGGMHMQAAPENPLPGLNTDRFRLWGFGQAPAQLPWPAVRPADERRFSYWGYRHAELHRRGVIAELLERTRGKNCCNGIDSGECRVSEVDLGARRVMVDGEWCPISPDTRITPLESLDAIADGDHPVAVVCASRTYGKRCDTTSYCIGVRGGT